MRTCFAASTFAMRSAIQIPDIMESQPTQPPAPPNQGLPDAVSCNYKAESAVAYTEVAVGYGGL